MQRYFIEEDIQIVTKHMKGCSTLLAVRELKLRPWWLSTTYLLEQIKQKTVTIKASEDAKILDSSYIAGGK